MEKTYQIFGKPPPHILPDGIVKKLTVEVAGLAEELGLGGEGGRSDLDKWDWAVRADTQHYVISTVMVSQIFSTRFIIQFYIFYGVLSTISKF